MILQSALGLSDTGYERVAQNFYQQELLIEIAALCVLGPLAEEIVYRGFVYQRLREKGSETLAAVCSALLFGVMHFNLVQCVYAFVLGILLAHIVNRTGSLLTAAAAHMAANLVSVLWTETDWLESQAVCGGDSERFVYWDVFVIWQSDVAAERTGETETGQWRR